MLHKLSVDIHIVPSVTKRIFCQNINILQISLSIATDFNGLINSYVIVNIKRENSMINPVVTRDLRLPRVNMLLSMF